jgi:Transglycosylase SLT domain
MARLTADEVAYYWRLEGGPASRQVEWTAIALGESSFITDALSPAGAIGLWQIMPFHAAEFGITVDSLYDPRTNAMVAVSLSGHGTNCAAWDSCYADINRSGRYSFLGYPEVGSADYNNIPIVARMLGQSPGIQQGGGPPPVDTHDYETALAHFNYMTARWWPAQSRAVQRERAVIDRMFTRGWRP